MPRKRLNRRPRRARFRRRQLQRGRRGEPAIRDGGLPSYREGDHPWHFDVRSRIAESVELLRVEKHHRAPQAGVERRGIESPGLALHRHAVPAIKSADATAPLSGRPPHRGQSLANLARPRESSAWPTELLDECVRSKRTPRPHSGGFRGQSHETLRRSCTWHGTGGRSDDDPGGCRGRFTEPGPCEDFASALHGSPGK